MYFSITTAALLAVAGSSLTSASPLDFLRSRQSSSTHQPAKYYGVGLEFEMHFPSPDNRPYYEPSPVEINQLTQINATGVYSISLDKTASNVNIDQVECRAYKDADGVVPGSAPFSKAHPALVSTTGVEIGSVLCYIVTEAEESS